MADLPHDVAEALNNAIYSLASLNADNPIAGKLNDSWQAWFSTQTRSILPESTWWLALKGFWAAYAAARASARNLNERTPPAESINPTLWKTLLSDIEERDALLHDASQAAKDKVHEELDAMGAAVTAKLHDAAKPAIFVSVVIGIALLWSSMRGK
jgi:hypothetical protein